MIRFRNKGFVPDAFKYYSPVAIRDLFHASEASIRKKWGQNFLIDPNISKKIAGLLLEGCTGAILEIGPGLGVLTGEFLKKNREVYAVEIDPFLVNELKKEFLENDNLHLFNQDARDFIQDLSAHKSDYEDFQIKCVGGNLPYYITSDLLTQIALLRNISKGVFLVQKEYAMRCVAERSESSLNVFLNNFGKWKIEMHVKPSAFFPAPSVNSSVLVFDPLPSPRCNPNVLQNILRMSFRGRRKKIRNSWSVSEAVYSSEKMEIAAEKEGISVEKRPEEISREEYYRLAACLEKIIEKE